MIRVQTAKFRQQMLYYMEKVAQGHRVVLLHYNEPIAELRLPADHAIIRADRLIRQREKKTA